MSEREVGKRVATVMAKGAAAGLAVALLLAGCASPARSGRSLPDPAALARDLDALTGGRAPEEARLIAETAIERARWLAVQYRAMRPAWFHNMLVNAGRRPRGLCYQWAQDLKAALDRLPLRAFELHWGCAEEATPGEHNAVVVTAKGRPFEEGIVLDAWRKSGVLCWAPVRKDKYEWLELDPPPRLPRSPYE